MGRVLFTAQVKAKGFTSGPNVNMTDRDPRFEQMRRYEPRRQPYVQVTDHDRVRYHARLIGWIPGEVFIEYPKQIIDYVTTGQLYPKWVSTGSTVRIRRADSIWLSVDDDDWHEAEDARITFRSNPRTVYTLGGAQSRKQLEFGLWKSLSPMSKTGRPRLGFWGLVVAFHFQYVPVSPGLSWFCYNRCTS